MNFSARDLWHLAGLVVLTAGAWSQWGAPAAAMAVGAVIVISTLVAK